MVDKVAGLLNQIEEYFFRWREIIKTTPPLILKQSHVAVNTEYSK